jgi:hypothetical protein
MPARSGGERRRPVFVVGAYLVGLLGRAFQTVETLVNIYLATTLPAYVQAASHLLLETGVPARPWQPTGVFPLERALLVGHVLMRVVPVGFAVGAFVIGTRSAYGVSKARALTAAVAGVACGLVATQAAGNLAVMLLAPTGLL